MDSPPPPLSSSSSSAATSFPILAISILGILTTVILLLSYYIFVTKCRLSWRRPSFLIRSLSPTQPIPFRRTPQPHPPGTDSQGLDPSSIRSIPIIQFNANAAAKSHECAVCLNDFHEEERLRLLPSCSHVFHIDCIDVWLQSNANCPLCRSDISNIPIIAFPLTQDQTAVVIEIRDQTETSSSISQPPKHNNSSNNNKSSSKRLMKRPVVAASMGDECIDCRGSKDERFLVQPVRRSFSMDSSNDRQLYIAVQEILQRDPDRYLLTEDSGCEPSTAAADRSMRPRSFFSFGHGRSWRRSVIPVDIQM